MNIIESTFVRWLGGGGKGEGGGMGQCPLFQTIIQLCLFFVTFRYFSEDSTQEMLDEWRPLLCPFDVKFAKAMFYFSLFLPTTLPPEKYDKGYKYVLLYTVII